MIFSPQLLHQRPRARGTSRGVEVLDYQQAQSIFGRVFTPLPFAPCIETAALDPKHAAAVDNRVLLTQLVDQRERSLESRSRRALAFIRISISRSFCRTSASSSSILCCSGVIALAPTGTLPALSSRTCSTQRRRAVGPSPRAAQTSGTDWPPSSTISAAWTLYSLE